MNYKLKKRLNRLPSWQYSKVKRCVISRSGVTEKTFHNVLNGKSSNQAVLIQLAISLGCSLEDVQNSEYRFTIAEKGKFNP